MKNRTDHRLWIVAIALLMAGGCVKKGVHEDVLAELAQRNADYTELELALQQCEALAAERMATIEAYETQVENLDAELVACRMQVEEQQSLLSQGDQAMRDLAQRLEDLRAVEAELRERDQILQSVLGAFQSLIDAGTLEVLIERGRLIIKLPQDILFASGSAELGDEGRAALLEVGFVLSTLDGREFQIEGHTDNVPIETRRFPSNWELSSARALAVVQLLIEAGVAPDHLSAAGFSEFRPRAPNDTPENKAQNRRIEIVMVPDLEAIFGGTR